METKRLQAGFFCAAVLLTLGSASSVFSQVKIGSNPTSISPNTNLEVEADNGNKVVVNKDNGKVGVGTVPGYDFDAWSPSVRLDVLGGSVRAGAQSGFPGLLATLASDNAALHPVFMGVRSRGTFASPSYLINSDNMGILAFRNHEGRGVQISAQASQNHSASAAGSELIFWTTSNNSTDLIRRMKISNTGDVGIGTGTAEPFGRLQVAGPIRAVASAYTGHLYDGTASIDGAEMYAAGTDSYIAVQRDAGTNLFLTKTASTAGDRFQVFGVNGAVVGSVTRIAGGISYNSTSDKRLKENINPTHYGIVDLMKIQVADYNYRSDKTKTRTTGFIAQDLYNVYPDAVTVGGEDANKTPWVVDYGKLTPLLVKAVQQQQVEIQALLAENQLLRSQTSKIEALTTRLADMEAKMGITGQERSELNGRSK